MAMLVAELVTNALTHDCTGEGAILVSLRGNASWRLLSNVSIDARVAQPAADRNSAG